MLKKELEIGLQLSIIFIMLSSAIIPMAMATSKNHIQPINTDEWKKTFGGDETDIGYDLKITDDGYVVIGTTQSKGAGKEDIWLIKTDADGTLQWDTTFGGKNGDIGYAVDQTNDGGFILTGYTWSRTDGKSDVWLIKTDANGNEEWNTTIGGTDADIGYDLLQTIDGGYIIVGSTLSEGAGKEDVYLIKTNESGGIQWTETYGGSETDVGRSIVQTSSGDFVIVGHTNSYGSGWLDLWIIKTDDQGNELWDTPFGGNKDDVGWAVEETNDEGYICTGYTKSFTAQNQDVWLVKFNKNGNQEWNKFFGNSGDDRGYDVDQTSDNGYIITGSRFLFDVDLWLIKTDSQGTEKWNRSFGIRETDIGRSVKQTTNGGYICSGWTRSYGEGEADVWLIKIPSQNHYPNKPTITGTDTGKTATTYIFSTTTTDQDDDPIWYQWNWGDGTTSDWLGPYQSTEPCEVTHQWTDENEYQITVQAKDNLDAMSPVSNPFTISITYQQAWLFGTIKDKETSDGSTQFSAETVISITTDPFEVKTVNDIRYMVTNEYLGIMTNSLILGKFNIQHI